MLLYFIPCNRLGNGSQTNSLSPNYMLMPELARLFTVDIFLSFPVSGTVPETESKEKFKLSYGGRQMKFGIIQPKYESPVSSSVKWG